jgi:GNAT superfamily N-acetyltransferase
MIMQWFRTPPPARFAVQVANARMLQVEFVTERLRPLFIEGYKRLSPESRRMRFFGQVSELSSKQLDFLAAPDGQMHLAYAAGELVGDALSGVGVGRCIRLDADSKIAEVALTVVDDCQGRGVGQILHAALHRHAAAVDIRQFIYDVKADNTRFSEHLEALGAEIVSRDRDITRLRMPVFTAAKQLRADIPRAARFAAVLADIYDR